MGKKYGSFDGGVRSPTPFLKNATVCGSSGYKLLNVPVLTLDVTVWGDLRRGGLK